VSGFRGEKHLFLFAGAVAGRGFHPANSIPGIKYKYGVYYMIFTAHFIIYFINTLPPEGKPGWKWLSFGQCGADVAAVMGSCGNLPQDVLVPFAGPGDAFSGDIRIWPSLERNFNTPHL
jgi:hypothetical protein